MLSSWLWNIFLFLFYLLLNALLAVGIYFLGKYLQWPYWLSISVFFGIIGLVVGGLFLRRYLFRKREKKFIKRVIQEEGREIDLNKVQDISIKELEDSWTKSIEDLKSSYLKHNGNPLYQLPWFMVMGESGVGKSTLIESSGLTSPFGLKGSVSSINKTKNCDWWFFNEAVVLDTAGKYSISENYPLDDNEWERLLSLISKNRKKEPINGVVVVVSVESLKQGEEANIYKKAQRIRQRIDQLMRVLGENFPIYIMVSKMDFLYGFLSFFSFVGDSFKKEALGVTNGDFYLSYNELFENAFTQVYEKVRHERIGIAENMSESNSERIAEALLFPKVFMDCKKPLKEFIRGLFEQNSYQETPIFRGIYFSSSKIEGEIGSPFSDTPIHENTLKQNKKTALPFFVKGFFEKILPRDRYLHHPIPEYIKWKNSINVRFAASWLLLWIALVGMLGYAYVKNINILQTYAPALSSNQGFNSNLENNMLVLTNQMQVIQSIDAANSGWFMPRFGFDASFDLENRLKQNFTNDFEKHFFLQLENNVMRNLSTISYRGSEEDVSELADFLMSEIMLLHSKLMGGRGGNELATSDFNDASLGLINHLSGKNSLDFIATVKPLIDSYMLWDNDIRDADRHYNMAKLMLVKLLNKKDKDLKWLTYKWFSKSNDITLEEYWPSLSSDYHASIKGAYTAEGRENIKRFLDVFRSSFNGNKDEFDTRVKAFWRWYGVTFFDEWYRFLEAYAKAYTYIANVDDRMLLTGTMAKNDSNQMIRVFKKATDEFQRFEKDGVELDGNAKNLIFIGEAIQNAFAKSDTNNTTILTTIESNVKNIGQKINTIKNSNAAAYQVALQNAAAAFKTYFDTFANLSSVGVSKSSAYTQTYNYYKDSNDFSKSKADFEDSYNKYIALAAAVNKESKITPLNKALLVEPFNFYVDYAINETSCVLNEKWGSDVIGKLQGAIPSDIPGILFDSKNGLLWGYISNTASVYLTQDISGYAPKVILGNSIPFDPSFLEFVNTATKSIMSFQDSYVVPIKALPVGDNAGSKTDPYGVVLSLSCGDKTQVLENYNYPSSQKFNWSSSQCGNVELKILFQNDTLVKTYTGRYGFAKFLDDFKGGKKVFSASDFPDSQGFFEENGIKEIYVNYAISGADKIVTYFENSPTRVPTDISKCWRN